MTHQNDTLLPIDLNLSVPTTEQDNQPAKNNTMVFPDSSELHITPPTLAITQLPTTAVTSRPTDLPTANPTLPVLKPAPSKAVATVGKNGDNNISESWLSDLNRTDRSSRIRIHSGKKILIIVSLIFVMTVILVATCLYTTSQCWRRWSGYSQIDLGGESIELGVVRSVPRDVFLDDSIEFHNENSYLKHRN